MKKILLVLGIAFFAFTSFGQELRCNIQVVSSQIQGTNKQVFQTLQNAIYEFHN